MASVPYLHCLRALTSPGHLHPPWVHLSGLRAHHMPFPIHRRRLGFLPTTSTTTVVPYFPRSTVRLPALRAPWFPMHIAARVSADDFDDHGHPISDLDLPRYGHHPQPRDPGLELPISDLEL